MTRSRSCPSTFRANEIHYACPQIDCIIVGSRITLNYFQQDFLRKKSEEQRRGLKFKQIFKCQMLFLNFRQYPNEKEDKKLASATTRTRAITNRSASLFVVNWNGNKTQDGRDDTRNRKLLRSGSRTSRRLDEYTSIRNRNWQFAYVI